MSGTNKLDKAYNYLGKWSSLFIPAVSDKEKILKALTLSVKSMKTFFFVTDGKNK
jgi:hypothetical protein